MRAAYLHILGSSALAQILLLVSIPFLMRKYDGNEFGVFGLYSIVAMVVSILASLKIDHSLHLTDVPQLVFSASVTMATFSVVIGISLLLVAGLWFSVDDIAIALLFGGCHAIVTTCTLMGNLRKRYRLVAIVSLLVPSVFVVLAFSLVDVSIGPSVLLLSQALAHLVAAAVALLCLRTEFTVMSLGAIAKVLKAHWQDVVYLVPSRFISILSANSTVIGSVVLFGAEFAGFVVVANRVSRAPVRVIGNGLSNTLRAAVGNDAILRRTFTAVSLISAGVGLLCILVVWVIPESSIERFIGEDWDGLKVVLLIGTVAAAFQLMGAAVDSVLTVYLKRRYFMLNVQLTLFALLALFLAYISNLNFQTYLITNAICMSFVYMRFFYEGWKHVS